MTVVKSEVFDEERSHGHGSGLGKQQIFLGVTFHSGRHHHHGKPKFIAFQEFTRNVERLVVLQFGRIAIMEQLLGGIARRFYGALLRGRTGPEQGGLATEAAGRRKRRDEIEASRIWGAAGCVNPFPIRKRAAYLIVPLQTASSERACQRPGDGRENADSLYRARPDLITVPIPGSRCPS
jgi:hypothetical protein